MRISAKGARAYARTCISHLGQGATFDGAHKLTTFAYAAAATNATKIGRGVLFAPSLFSFMVAAGRFSLLCLCVRRTLSARRLAVDARHSCGRRRRRQRPDRAASDRRDQQVSDGRESPTILIHPSLYQHTTADMFIQLFRDVVVGWVCAAAFTINCGGESGGGFLLAHPSLLLCFFSALVLLSSKHPKYASLFSLLSTQIEH